MSEFETSPLFAQLMNRFLPQKIHSDERRKPTKNPFAPRRVIPTAARPRSFLGRTGVTGGVGHEALILSGPRAINILAPAVKAGAFLGLGYLPFPDA